MNIIYVGFKRLDSDIKAFTQAYPGDACYDLYNRHETIIQAYHNAHLDFGVAVDIPEGYEGQIRSRSGWSRRGVYIIHGTIDSNYRGEVGANVINATDEVVIIERGAKMAQFAVRPVPEVAFVEAKELTKSNRGDRGFGSSGM